MPAVYHCVAALVLNETVSSVVLTLQGKISKRPLQDPRRPKCRPGFHYSADGGGAESGQNIIIPVQKYVSNLDCARTAVGNPELGRATTSMSADFAKRRPIFRFGTLNCEG